MSSSSSDSDATSTSVPEMTEKPSSLSVEVEAASSSAQLLSSPNSHNLSRDVPGAAAAVSAFSVVEMSKISVLPSLLVLIQGFIFEHFLLEGRKY